MNKLRLAAFTLLVVMPTYHYAELNWPQTPESRHEQYKTAISEFETADHIYNNAINEHERIMGSKSASQEQKEDAEEKLKQAREKRRVALKQLQKAENTVKAARRQSDEDEKLAKQIETREYMRVQMATRAASTSIHQTDARELRRYNDECYAINQYKEAIKTNYRKFYEKDPHQAEEWLRMLLDGDIKL